MQEAVACRSHVSARGMTDGWWCRSCQPRINIPASRSLHIARTPSSAIMPFLVGLLTTRQTSYPTGYTPVIAAAWKAAIAFEENVETIPLNAILFVGGHSKL